jgi:toxin ParE1/3/4
MSRIELAAEVALDFERIIDHLQEHGVADAPSRIKDIIAAIDVLERNPLIGRPVNARKRELVIGRRTRGYVALYRFIAEADTVLILAIRSQREAGYAREWPPRAREEPA